jgi:TonB family protein
MLKQLTILLLCITAATAVASDKDAESALAQFHGKVLVLRHPTQNDRQRYAADGNALDATEGPWTVYSGVLVDKTTLTPEQLRIDGRRILFLFLHQKFTAKEFKQLKADREPPFPTSIRLEIKLDGALDSAEQARAILNRVFALNTAELLDSVPDFWRKSLDGHLSYDPSKAQDSEFSWQEPPPAPRKPPQTEEIPFTKNLQIAEGTHPVLHVGGDVKAPQPTFTPEPQYSEIARYEKFQGTLVVNLIVGSDGVVHRLHVVRPLGLGLDESAESMIKTWRFLPATKAGQPVAVEMNVEVGFHLY